MKKRIRLILSIVLAVLVLTGAAAYVYLSDFYRADDAAQAAMAETAQVQLEQDGYVTWFVPASPSAGLIFYPGGKVEHTAYAPLLRACAERGILCALVKMPANLAVLRPNAADGLREAHPEVADWYLAGHSLGGAMAASYAASHAQAFDGLILLAAYSTSDLRRAGLRVLSVYGSEDGVMNRESYEKYRPHLPEDAEELVLAGGCHAQFGSYGPQDGDGVPTISGAEQILRTADAIAAFLEK